MKSFLSKYKLFFIPAILLLFFIATILLSLIFNEDSNPNIITPEENPNLTSGPLPKTTPRPREGAETEVEDIPGLQNKETLPDGTIKYIFTSHIPERPNIILAKGEHDVLFQRSITLESHQVRISHYTDAYGQAKWIFKGSSFYGPSAQTYIYPERGFAFIGNPTTGEVLEQHVFQPLKVEEYVSRYGEDIPAQP